MRSRSDRDFPGVMLVPVLSLVCCVGLPLLLTAGAASAAWIVGAGVPLIVTIALVGLTVQRLRQRRATRTRGALRGSTAVAPGRGADR